MQRNRGQFTSSKSKAEDAISGVTSSEGSPNWGSVEGRPPSAAEYDLPHFCCYTLINIIVQVSLPYNGIKYDQLTTSVFFCFLFFFSFFLSKF